MKQKKKKKAVLQGAILTALLSAGAGTAWAEGVTTQDGADASLNTPLQIGDVLYTGPYIQTQPGKLLEQVRGEEALSIHGNDEGSTALSLELAIPAGTNYSGVSNLVSSSDAAPITLSKLNKLTLSLSGTGQNNRPTSTNMGASGGSITVDSSVKELQVDNAVNIATLIGTPNDACAVSASGNGTVTVYSPKVTLSSGGRGNTVFAKAGGSGTNALVYLGDETHVLDSVTLSNTNTTQGDRFGLAVVAGNSADAHSQIHVYTKALSISDMSIAIRTNGDADHLEQEALVQVGSKDIPVENIDINSNNGAAALYNGTIHMYGTKISIAATDYGLQSRSGGKLTVGAGSGEGDGLFLNGPGGGTSFGIASFWGETSTVDVVSGNVDIDKFTNGVWAGSTGAYRDGSVHIGTEDAKVGNVTISNGTYGVYSSQGGKIYFNADSLAVSEMRSGINAIVEGTVSVKADDVTVSNATAGSGTYGVLSNGGDVTITANQLDMSNVEKGLYSSSQGTTSVDAGAVTIKNDTLPNNSYSYGIYSRSDGSEVSVKAGALDISTMTYGVYSDRQGKISLAGRDDNGGDVTISNGSKGIYSTSQGEISIDVDNFTVTDEEEEAIYASRGTIDIHTSGMAKLEAINEVAYTALMNTQGGTVSINTEADDGSTVITGQVYTIGADGTTKIGLHTAQSVFTGNVHDDNEGKTTLMVSDGGLWKVDGVKRYDQSSYHSELDTLVLSDGGTVDLGADGLETVEENGYADVQVTNLTGKGGTLVFRTNLVESADTNTVNGHSDQLTITGSSEGFHNILINDHSQLEGNLAKEGYVLLVKDQSTNPQTTFTGGGTLQNGGLFLREVEITNEAPDAEMGYTDVPNDGMNWYARLTDKTLTPSDNGKNHAAFAHSRYGALWLEEETLRKRLGDLRENGDDEGIWGRITQGEYKMDGLGGVAGYTMYQLGYDKELAAKSGQTRYAGVAFHHTDTDMNYTGFGKDSDMDSNIGTLYYTTLYDSGHYLDLVGKLGRVKGKLDTRGEFPETARWQSIFYSLSAEYGRKLTYENGWYLEPQAQLTYSHLGSESYTSSQDTEGHLDAIDSLILRAGTTLGRKQGDLDYYAKLFVHHEFSGDVDARFHDKNDDNLNTSYDMGGTWLTAGIGAQYRITKDVCVYGDAERSFGGDIQKKWEWNLGVRYAF